MDLLDTVKNLSVSRRRSLRDDDFFIDRLHHRYTVAALVLFCAVLTTNQYAGDPINCWVPAQFTGSFEAYTNRLCWLQNTYYVEDNSDIPDSMDARRGAMLKYYQWIHLIILFQSMLFIIPRVIWRSMNDKCGIEIVNYVDAAIKYETVDKFAEREKLMEFLTGHINTFIKARENYELGRDKLTYQVKRALGMILFWTGKRYGNYLIILYIFCKFLYLLNVFGQLFLMTLLLGINNYHLLGFEILSRMAKGQDMISNHYFPKVTHCDFKIRELGSDHLYTVQCVLSINIFTEKIYVLLWFWFVILTTLTLVDLLTFIAKNCFASQRYSYIKKHVVIFTQLKTSQQNGGTTTTTNARILNEFATEYLKPDVILVLKILATNVNGLVVSELVKYLWDSYLLRYQNRRPGSMNKLDDQSDTSSSADDPDDFVPNEHTPAFPPVSSSQQPVLNVEEVDKKQPRGLINQKLKSVKSDTPV